MSKNMATARASDQIHWPCQSPTLIARELKANPLRRCGAEESFQVELEARLQSGMLTNEAWFVQVTRKWLNWEGVASVQHIAALIEEMEEDPRVQHALTAKA